MNLRPGVFTLACLALLAACVRPQREDPHVAAIETQTLGLAGPAAPRPEGEWWQAFGDPQLDRFIGESFEHNPTLAEALARVRSAQAQVLAADATIKPDITIDGNEIWQRFSKDFYYPPPFAGGRFWVGQLGVNLAWMLDFWGHQAALIRQARDRRA
jgi:outer membrane protein TolC